MKTSQSLCQRLSLLAGGLLICLPAGFAAPGGGAAVGTASAGGGHAVSAAPAAAAHSSGAGGGFRSSIGSTSGYRSSLGAAGYQTRSASSAVRPVPNIAANPGFSGDGITRAYAPVTRVNNAWTDPVNSRAASASGISRYGNARVGTNLYPGAYGYTPSRPAQRGQNGSNGSRGHHRYFYNNFPYGVYYPYLYNNFGYGGYGGYGDYGYDGTADYTGLTADATSPNLGTPDFSNTPNNYYSYADPGPDNAAAAPATPAQPLPAAPAVGPQDPSAADQSPAASSQGPDSLVEAVQGELARRGYFEGKPDSMYSPATKEAIRRFQTDQHLPATGRINEATLHALRLD